ncbi:hypothetical protein [uncultured Arthrobacter sp.]|uniref:hypothetical protein n=1 Tax=uncultured Arthrobacter sp. TaxID=114050 RepID=UPI002610DCF4|nr:hypothetical protein [uncultured Arthrobacter sp.]
MTRKPKGPNRSRKTSKASKKHRTTQPPTPLDLVRVDRELDSLTPAFAHWFEETVGSPAEQSLPVLGIVRNALSMIHEVSGFCYATSFSAESIGAVIKLAEEYGMPEPLLEVLLEGMHLYADFLSETGRWTGTPEDYDEVHALLSSTDDGVESDDELPAVSMQEVEKHLPRFSSGEELAVLSQVSIIQRTEQLLLWLGESKEATSTGALRLKDIQSAAHCVGVKARGLQNTKRENTLPGLEEHRQTGGGITVRSMHEVPILNAIWATLTGIGYLTLGSATVRPGHAVQNWFLGTDEQKVTARRNFLTAYVRVCVLGEEMWSPVQPLISASQIAVLLKGVTPDPVPLAFFQDEDGPGTEDIFMAMARPHLVKRLQHLADVGILEPGPMCRVVPAAAASIAAAFPDGFDQMMHEVGEPVL